MRDSNSYSYQQLNFLSTSPPNQIGTIVPNVPSRRRHDHKSPVTHSFPINKAARVRPRNNRFHSPFPYGQPKAQFRISPRSTARMPYSRANAADMLLVLQSYIVLREMASLFSYPFELLVLTLEYQLSNRAFNSLTLSGLASA